MYLRLLLFISVSLFAFRPMFSQVNKKTVIYDHVYVDNIKSVELKKRGTPFSLPIIDLNSRAQLTLSFDDLNLEDKHYIYEVYRCNKDWQASELDEIEYLEGFNGEELRDFWYSNGTVTPFTHYRLDIPNDDIRWTKSGNYVVIIYEEFDDGKEPVLTRRFMVTEDQLTVKADFVTPIGVSFFKSHHSININVLHKNFNITNPMNEINLTVLQNGRWDNAKKNEIPRFTKLDELVFNNIDAFVFPAFKEFRSFDIRSLRSAGDNVHSIDLHDDGTDVLLDLSFPRFGDNHLTYLDINGQFYISNDDNNRTGIGGSNGRSARENMSINSSTSADYANVIFTLKSKRLEDDVYIIGKFTNWEAQPEFKMEYDEQRKIYICETPLKQGRYEYLYGVLTQDGLDFDYTEGNRFETENEYTILVYYSEFGSRHDRLIKVRSINSNFLNR